MTATSLCVRFVAAILIASSLAGAAPAPPPSQTHILYQGRLQPAWFLCDGVDQPAAYAVGQPDRRGRLSILSLTKLRAASPTVQALNVGPADPGAGNVYYGLTRRGTDAGFLHSVNPGVFSDPASLTLPPFTSVKLGGVETACRMAPHARLLGFDSRRSVLVTQEARGGLTYRTFNAADIARAKAVQGDNGLRSTNASLTIANGVVSREGAATVMSFTNQGYVYQVRIGPSGAMIMVRLRGRLIQQEALVAYSTAG